VGTAWPNDSHTISGIVSRTNSPLCRSPARNRMRRPLRKARARGRRGCPMEAQCARRCHRPTGRSGTLEA
jgi:hypothetical protein